MTINISSNELSPPEVPLDGEYSPMQNFYKDRSIFITGASGFMGKVLLEKLLRSCPEVRQIYLLLRAKKGKESRHRLEEMVKEKIFDRVREAQPSALKKLVAVDGDVSLPMLGLDSSTQSVLANEVSVVFHVAATVKFDMPLKDAVSINVIGTRRLLEFCHQLPKIAAVVHVSTAYCNCNRGSVDELIYPPPYAPQQIVDTTGWLNNEILESITPKLLGDRPNTYTFTKALAENVVSEESGCLPVAIVRPSIVTASWKEPYPGWVDSLNGPTGLVVAAGKGVLRTMVIHGEKVADLMPVDVAINLFLAVAWYTATRRPNGIMVYNCVSRKLNKTTWNDILQKAHPHVLRYPSTEIFRYPGGGFKRSHVYNWVCIMLDHYFPAVIADILAVVMRQKPRMVRIYKKIHRAMECLEYFATREWNFRCDNVIMLRDCLQGPDKKTFNFDISAMDWDSYWECHVLGTRKYLLKEDPSTIVAARKSMARRYMISRLTQLALLVFLWKVFISKFFTGRQMWFFITTIVVRMQTLLSSSQS